MDITKLKKAHGFENLYITEDGSAYKLSKIALAERVSVDGKYKRTEQQYSNVPFHRIMAKTFLDNPKELPEVDHKDHNPMNNNLNNLQWITQRANTMKQSFNKSYRYKGIEHDKDRDKYRGNFRMKIDGVDKRFRTSRYDTMDEAADARLELIKEVKAEYLSGYSLT